jgi:hypothetical protein
MIVFLIAICFNKQKLKNTKEESDSLKCLSIRQPYAERIVSGKQTIETRDRNIVRDFRGKFLIHASRTVDKESCHRLKLDSNSLTKDAIIGCAFLYDVKIYSNERNMNKKTKYGFLLKDAKKLNNPVPLPGQRGFFEVPTEPIRTRLNTCYE